MELTSKNIDYGPLDKILKDEAVSEVMVNSWKQIFYETRGQIKSTDLKFESEASLQALIKQIANSCGRQIGAERPFFDGYLPDGSRVNSTIPPMSPNGSSMTIRKFKKIPYQLADLVKLGALSEKAAFFIRHCVRSRISIIISGGTGTGKTTFLNVISGLIPIHERIVTIEDTAELQLQHPNWVKLESVYSMSKPIVTIRDCLVNSLRMRPDRIIVGECRNDEAFEMLQAMNTGHEGSLTTIHSNSPRDCLMRIESLVMSGSNVEIPILAIRKQMTSAIQLIVQLKRMPDGKRVISEIVEITGMERDVVVSQAIFTREKKRQAAVNENELVSTGLVPKFYEKMVEEGSTLPTNFFATEVQGRYRDDS